MKYNMDYKELSKQLCATFNLKSITSKTFAHKIECILVGLTFIKVPNRDYKLFFTIYPLWRSTLKSCIEVPLLLQPLADDNGLDIYLSDFIDIIDRCNSQFPLLRGCNSAADFVRFLYNIIATDKAIQANFILKMKIYELIYCVALYNNDVESAKDVYSQISSQISNWDTKIFNYWYGDKDTTLSKLLEFEPNRCRIIENVSLNTSDPKITKLPTYKFIVE